MFPKSIRTVAIGLVLLPATALADLSSLTVNVTGAAPIGTVEVSLFNSPENFLKQPYEQRRCRPAEDGSCVVRFAALAQGDYALVAVHDTNDNNKMDNGFLGFGAEPFAYSNDASNPIFGRASFEDARIELSEDSEIEISLD